MNWVRFVDLSKKLINLSLFLSKTQVVPLWSFKELMEAPIRTMDALNDANLQTINWVINIHDLPDLTPGETAYLNYCFMNFRAILKRFPIISQELNELFKHQRIEWEQDHDAFFEKPLEFYHNSWINFRLGLERNHFTSIPIRYRGPILKMMAQIDRQHFWPSKHLVETRREETRRNKEDGTKTSSRKWRSFKKRSKIHRNLNKLFFF